jgi:hypothetical protein
MVKTFPFIFFILMFCFSRAQDSDLPWIYVKEIDGVSIYHRYPKNSELKELKLITTARTNAKNVVYTLTNIDSLPQWGYLCIEASMVRFINKNEIYYYFVSGVPWPLSDRDIVIHMKVTQDSTGIITINSKNFKGLVPEKNDLVRIKNMKAKWVLTPLNNEFINIEYYISMDPGGLIPKWMVNFGMTQGPVNTMNSLKEIVER